MYYGCGGMGIREIYKGFSQVRFLVKKYVLTSNVGVNLHLRFWFQAREKMCKPEHRVYGFFTIQDRQHTYVIVTVEGKFSFVEPRDLRFFLIWPTSNRVRTNWGRSKCPLHTTEYSPLVHSKLPYYHRFTYMIYLFIINIIVIIS